MFYVIPFARSMLCAVIDQQARLTFSVYPRNDCFREPSKVSWRRCMIVEEYHMNIICAQVREVPDLES